MWSFLKAIGILALSGNALYADTFVYLNPPVKKSVVISSLTPFDEALHKEMQKYPRDSAFFVDGKTGKILSVNQLPSKQSLASSPEKQPPKTKPTASTKAQKPISKFQSATSVIPYEMQEERIELLQ